MNTENRVVAVTGSGAGIGQAVAVAFAEKGTTVIVSDVNTKSASETADLIIKCGGDAVSIFCDVGEVASIENMFGVISAKFGKLDVLVNNAGIALNTPIGELEEDQWDRTMNINLKGTFFCSKYAFLMMKVARQGAIVNMASIAGERGGLFAGVDYSSSKGGIIAMTKSFALNGAEYGITANAIAPGTVETDITKRLGHTTDSIPLGRMALPEEIADATVFLASDKARYITGMVLDMNGGQLMR